MWSGVAVVAAPAVEREQSLGHGSYALVVFAVPMLASALLEAGLAIVSDRVPRRRFIVGGLLVLASALLLCAFAPSAWWLSAALAIAGAASGAACGAAQIELIAEQGGAADKAMSRWTLFAAAGDVVTPLVVAGTLKLGVSYRGALVVIAAVLVAQATAVARRGGPAVDVLSDEDEASAPLREVLSRGLRRGRLWAWLLGAAFCTLLDEIVAALASLRLRVDLGASEAAAAACLAAFSSGSTLGAIATERLVGRASPRAILLGSAAACAASLVLVLLAPSPALTTLALVPLGASAAPHYTLAKARAYEAVPESPGLVNAAAQAFVVLDLVAPLALGLVADRRGLRAALACLLVQPIALFALTLLLERKRAASHSGSTERSHS
jgi:MFS family permease